MGKILTIVVCGIRQSRKNISDFVYSRGSGAEKESARYIQDEEDTCLATVGGLCGDQGRGAQMMDRSQVVGSSWSTSQASIVITMNSSTG